MIYHFLVGLGGLVLSRPLILGTGYVAQAYAQAWGLQTLSRHRVNYESPERFNLHLMTQARPSAVINCAGFTGRPNIDQCERNLKEAIEANIVLPANLSRVCMANGIPFVHISSGCLYHGGSHLETDAPDEPLSLYSRTKYLAEQVVTGYSLRIRMPFGLEPHPRSFITKINGYQKLISEPNSLTFLPDLINATEALIEQKAPYGVYNVVNSGVMTHLDIALMFGWRKQFVNSLEGLATSPRSNCELLTDKLAPYFKMPSVQMRLKQTYEWQKEAA